MSFEKLILNNIEILSYNHQNNFLGEKSFHYSTTKTLSLKGYVLDLQNSVGIKDILVDINTIKNISENFQNVIINGINFGIGKITSLSFDQGNWVRSTQFNAEVEIYQTANLQNLVSKEFTPTNYVISSTAGASPDLLGYKFYKTNLTNLTRPIYYDTTNTYALWSNGSTWRITSISNVGIGSAVPRFQLSVNQSTPAIGTYLSQSGWSGSITLSIDNDYTLDFSTDRFDLLKSFNETFNLDFDNNTKILGGTHSIEIEYTADNKDLNVIFLAQSLAIELLNKSIPRNLSEYNYATRPEGSYKILKNETYDVINGKCGFTKTFSYSTDNNFKPYSINRNLNIDINIDGIATVNENCGIKAENDNPSLYDNALIGLNEQITGAYIRCSGFFDAYKSKLGISGSLNLQMLQKNIRINKYDGTLEYNVNFNNDKKNKQSYIFDYTSILDRDQGFIWTVSEQGSIIGNGQRNNNTKYISAESGWANIKTGIFTRSSGFWYDQTKEKASNNLNPITQNISRLPFQGKITYNYKYTDDPTLRNDLGDIKRIQIEYNDNANAGASKEDFLPIFKEIIIPNNTYALIHNRSFRQQGTFSINAKADIVLTGQNSVFNGLLYFNDLKTQVRNNYVGGSTDKYLESAEFSSDEVEQTITYSETYKYS
jgi:hypothetical protein